MKPISWVGVVLGGAAVALVVFLGLLAGEHLWQDHVDHHLMLDVLKYNIQQGKLLQLPVVVAEPTPLPLPAPEPKK